MKKILIVDDEKNIRLTLQQSLKSDTYETDIALNGEEALDKIQEQNFDLMLLDIRMPGLSGMEVLKKIREFNSKINIIMMTAYGTIEQAVEAMKLGAVDFISKPFTPNEIRSIIEEVFYRETINQNELSSFHNITSFAKKCIIEHKYAKAEEYLNKAISLKNDEAEPHNMMGNIYEVKGNYENALREYRVALEINPNNEQAMINKNRLLDFIGFMNQNKEDKNEK